MGPVRWGRRHAVVFHREAPGDPDYRNFKERYGVRCAGKFTNVNLSAGTLLELRVGGGGGYGKPADRDCALIAEDLLLGLYDEETTRRLYPDQVDEALAIRDELLADLRRRSAG